MSERKASDLFVECLEAEGVKHVFGIPGEETLDFNESLERSSIAFVTVRHEQGGAYMADMYGRLTQRAGVCLGTLGPGATNLVTGVADAFLDRAPLVALTGQADLARMHKESHQHIDVVSMLRPVTKWNARLSSSHIIPEVVRKAFKVAQAQKPGATHIELPEDVMASQVRASRCPCRPSASRVEPSERDLQQPPRSSATRPARSCSPATASRATGRRRRCASSPPPPASGWRRRSWARARSTTRTSTRSARSGCSRATTRSRASRTPTSSSPSATTSSSTRPRTGTPAATRRSSPSTRPRRRSTRTSSPRSNSSATSTTSCPG